MARILLGGFEEAQALSLAHALRLRNHHVDHSWSSTDRFEEHAANSDVVILDLSGDDPSTRLLLEKTFRLRLQTGLRPMLLGILQTYRGPRFEEEIERKGVRVIYVS